MRGPAGIFCLGNPTREGEKGEGWPYFVLERGGGGILPSRREGCDFAVLRTRCGIPPLRVNPDGAGAAMCRHVGMKPPSPSPRSWNCLLQRPA